MDTVRILIEDVRPLLGPPDEMTFCDGGGVKITWRRYLTAYVTDSRCVMTAPPWAQPRACTYQYSADLLEHILYFVSDTIGNIRTSYVIDQYLKKIK